MSIPQKQLVPSCGELFSFTTCRFPFRSQASLIATALPRLAWSLPTAFLPRPPSLPPCTRRDVCHIDDGPVLLSPTLAILSVPIAFPFLPMLVPTVFFSFFPSYYLRLALLLVTIKCGFMRRGAYCRKIRDVCTLIRNCVFVTSVSGAKDGSTKRLDSDAFAFLVQTTCQSCFLARWPWLSQVTQLFTYTW